MKKLIRDKIAFIISNEKGSSGKNISLCSTRQEKMFYLAAKIIEEATELNDAIKSENIDSMIEEFADVLEVLDAIRNEMTIDDERIQETKTKKLQDFGGFVNGFILDIDK